MTVLSLTFLYRKFNEFILQTHLARKVALAQIGNFNHFKFILFYELIKDV